MVFVLAMTTLIDGWTFTSKPIICEYPMTKDFIFNNFTRALRVIYDSRNLDEYGIDRSHEGKNSQEFFTLQIRTTNEPDLKQIIADIRTGIAELPSSAFYPWIDISSEEDEQGNGAWLAVIRLSARRVGKFRDI